MRPVSEIKEQLRKLKTRRLRRTIITALVSIGVYSFFVRPFNPVQIVLFTTVFSFVAWWVSSGRLESIEDALWLKGDDK